MKKLLLALLLASSVAVSAVAQPADERLGYAARGSHPREALASAQKTSIQPSITVGEIYPNPAAGEASISLNLNAAGKVTFYNLLGTPVASQEFGKDARTLTIDFAPFPEGVYFGIISVGNKTVATRRVSVRR